MNDDDEDEEYQVYNGSDDESDDGMLIDATPASNTAPNGVNIQKAAEELMALSGITDLEEAKQILSVFNYDLQTAATSILDGTGASGAAAMALDSKGPLGAEFASLYEPKFGLLHPVFFNEDYEGALRAGKSQGRIVLVYVYSDYEEDASDHFCRSVLSRGNP